MGDRNFAGRIKTCGNDRNMWGYKPYQLDDTGKKSGVKCVSTPEFRAEVMPHILKVGFRKNVCATHSLFLRSTLRQGISYSWT